MPLFQRSRQKRRGILLDHAEDGNQRCAGCDAVCCRAFPSVELTAEEYKTLEQLGAKRLERTLNGHYFLMIEYGCEFLEDNRCSIHQDRPMICRRFTCTDPF